jgi:hypothetical protein
LPQNTQECTGEEDILSLGKQKYGVDNESKDKEEEMYVPSKVLLAVQFPFLFVQA